MGIFSESDNRRRDGGFPYMGSRHLGGAAAQERGAWPLSVTVHPISVVVKFSLGASHADGGM